MRGLFEAVDAGQYDRVIITAMAVLLILTWVAERVLRHRLGREFFEARDRAQAAYEDPLRGAHSMEYLSAALEALDRWEQWQNRPLPSPEHPPDYPTAAEWHILPFLSAAQTDAHQRAM